MFRRRLSITIISVIRIHLFIVKRLLLRRLLVTFLRIIHRLRRICPSLRISMFLIVFRILLFALLNTWSDL